MFESWQEAVRFGAAGGIGGLLYWAISHRDAIFSRLRQLISVR